MYLFYETLPEPVTGNTSSVISIDSCLFRNGVDISEESSGLSIYFYYAIQGNVNISAKTIRKRSIFHGRSKFCFL